MIKKYWKLATTIAALALVLMPSTPEAQDRTTTQREASQNEPIAETERLAKLIEVWGFAKYHHPKSRDPEFDWDAEFVALVPQVIDASKQGEIAILAEWLDRLGPIVPCDPCVDLPEDMLISPPTPAWIEDGRLGEALSRRIRAIYDNRSPDGPTAQLTLAKGIENPVFEAEKAYKEGGRLTEPERLLALARYWNVLRYWFPYRDLLSREPRVILRDYIPQVRASDGGTGYIKFMTRFSREFGDGHSRITGFGRSFPSPGRCSLPLRLRYIGDRLVVDEFATEGARKLQVRIGDVVNAIDGLPIQTLRYRYAPYLSASNAAAESAMIAFYVPFGECATAELDVSRNGQRTLVSMERVPYSALDKDRRLTRDRPGDAFQILDGNVGYLKLSSIRKADIDTFMEQALSATGLIIDIRNYPAEFVVFDLGRWLVKEPTPFVRFSRVTLATPGAIRGSSTLSLRPDDQGRSFDKPVIVLIDETSGSQAEYTAMALRAGGAILVGSRTAGADGNISYLPLPRGGQAVYSGLGVFYPDYTATQRVGILPDHYVQATPEGLAAGKDEVLERAVAVLSRATGAGS